MNKLYIFWGWMLATIVVQAQNNFTLQQCIDYALNHQATYQNSKLDVEIAKAKVGEIRGIGLPQIKGSGTFLRNIDVQKQFVPANAFNPMASKTEVMPLGFGLPYSNLGQISVTQLIFDGSYIVGLQATKTYLSLSEKAVDASKAAIIQNVKKAYLGVLVSQERIKLLDLNIARLDSNLKNLIALNKSGFVENIDADRLEVQLNNLKIEKQKIENFGTLSILALKFQIGMPLTESLSTTETLDTYKSDMNIAESAIVYENKPEYTLLNIQKRASELELKNLRYGRFPTLAAFGNLGANTGSFDMKGVFNNTYYQFSNIGLSLSVPIFDGTQRYYKMSSAKVKIKKSENDLLNLKNAIDMQAASAKINLDNNKKSLENNERNMNLAKKVLDISSKKYNAGVGSSLEITNAESEYKTAYVNYYTTLYDCLINKVDYDYAVGNLK